MSKQIRPAAELRQYLRENGWNLSAAFLLTYWLQGTVFGTSGNALFEEGGAEIMLGAAENAGALFFVLLFLTYCRRLKWVLVPLTLLLFILEPFAGMTGNALLTPANIETLLGSDIHEALAVLRTASPLDFVLPGFWTVLIEWMIAAKVKPFPPAETRTKFIWSISALCALPLVFITAPVGSMAFSVSEAGKTASWHALPESEQESAAGTAPEISTRVLVIGEALRADALQLYGNPFETSPFLSSVPVKMIRTAVSPSMETMTAVPLMLTLSGNQNGTLRPQLENNAVALAGEAGWKTYWISAQGKHRSDDLPVARIAGHADEAVWIDRHDDTKLPKVFEEILNRQDSERNSRKRFFVIHAYGSHEDVCDRTEDMGRPFAAGKEKYLDCYLASALKADRIIERLVRALEKRRAETGEGWSLVITSDHASAIERRPGGALVHRRDVTNAHMYIVPFVQMGSDIREGVGFDTVRAMNRFAEWFPNWMGFGTNLTDPEFDIFTAPDDDPVIVRPDGQTVPFRDLKKGQSFTEILGIEKEAKEGGRHGH